MSRIRSERGQAILEFALAMPFFLMFIMFMTDLALLGYSYISVTNAVREGARCGAVGATEAAVVQRVQDGSGGLANFNTASIIQRDDFIGGNIEVEAEYQYDWITPVSLVPGLGGTVDFTKNVVMRTESASPYTKDTCQ
jgi:hypothetical protein